MEPSEPLLTSAEVASLLRVHPKHVYRLLARGLPARRAGGKWLFARGEVLEWARGGSAAATAGPPVVEAHPSSPPPPRASEGAEAPPLLAANGDVPIEILLARASDRGAPVVGFVQADREAALDLVLKGHVLAGAWHGEPPSTLQEQSGLVWVHLADREVGLATRARRLASVAAIRGLRLASRPPTAGVRACLDAALAKAAIDSAELHETATVHPTHFDVTCAVAAGRADVGLTTRAWADRLGLEFLCLGREPYGLFVRAGTLGDPRVGHLCRVVQSAEYRRDVESFGGYDPSSAGEVRFDPRRRATPARPAACCVRRHGRARRE